MANAYFDILLRGIEQPDQAWDVIPCTALDPDSGLGRGDICGDTAQVYIACPDFDGDEEGHLCESVCKKHLPLMIEHTMEHGCFKCQETEQAMIEAIEKGKH